jgi:NADH-quinone oxidoreductase subunit N
MTLTPLIEANWHLAILPEILLVSAGILLILLEAFTPRWRAGFALIATLFLLAAAYAEVIVPTGVFFGGTYSVGPLTQFFDLVFILAAVLAVLLSNDYLKREGLDAGEYYALILWGTVGMMMMAKGLELLIVILGLEILSICIFVLVGFHKGIPISNEASLKYFLMGAFATGFILYGAALFYGATGSTNVDVMREHFSTFTESPGILTIAFVMLMGGFGFKLALVPFHAWAPDVYQGAPSPVAGWLSTAPKAATLVAVVRLFEAVLPTADRMEWGGVLAVLAIASMVIGNLVAIAQRDLKRMLAYSGIAHVGYMMIAVFVLRAESIAAIGVYAVTYALMNIGAFGVIALIEKNQNDPQTLSDVAGLGFRRPFYGLALAVCMFSLAGLPPTAGFMAKLYIFRVAVEANAIGIAVVGIVMSIISVYYYLRVVYYVYMKEADETTPALTEGVFATGALAISVVGILAIGLFPAPLFRTALNAATLLLQR